MNQNLLQDIGENFEYIKTIVSNTVEIKKIEATESVSKLLGRLVLTVIGLVVSAFILIGICIMGVIWLTPIIGSTIQTIALFCGGFFMLLVLLYLLRKPLLYKPCSSFIYSLLNIH